MWWVTPVILVLRKQKQDCHELEFSLICLVNFKLVSLELHDHVSKKEKKMGKRINRFRPVSKGRICAKSGHIVNLIFCIWDRR